MKSFITKFFKKFLKAYAMIADGYVKMHPGIGCGCYYTFPRSEDKK